MLCTWCQWSVRNKMKANLSHLLSSAKNWAMWLRWMNDKIKKYDKLDNTKRFIKSTVDHVELHWHTDRCQTGCRLLRLSAGKYWIVRSLSRLIALEQSNTHKLCKNVNLCSYVLSEQRVWACVSIRSVI